MLDRRRVSDTATEPADTASSRDGVGHRPNDCPTAAKAVSDTIEGNMPPRSTNAVSDTSLAPDAVGVSSGTLGQPRVRHSGREFGGTEAASPARPLSQTLAWINTRASPRKTKFLANRRHKNPRTGSSQ